MRVPRGFVCPAALCAVAVSSLLIQHALPARDDREPAGVSVEVSKTHLDFKAGKDLITSYRIDPKQSKPYFFPMNALPGVGVTEDGPSDHVHHRSAWFCHGDITAEGLEVKKPFKEVKGTDFWSERKGAGRIVCVKVEKPTAGKSSASVVTRNEWRTADGKKVLDEVRTITLHHLGENRNLLVIDADIEASEYPLIFEDTKEGSMGIRIRHSIRVDKKGGGKLTNAEGKENQKECWGKVSAWCDYSGPIGEGKTAGLTVFADPKNEFDSAWHARDYGLLAANPFGRAGHAKFPDRKDRTDLVKVEKGKHLRLRFGLYLHGGDVKEGKVAEAYKSFVALRGK